MKKHPHHMKAHHAKIMGLPRHADGNVSAPPSFLDRVWDYIMPARKVVRDAAATGNPSPGAPPPPSSAPNQNIDYVRKAAEDAGKRMQDQATKDAASKNMPAHQTGDVSAPMGGVPMDSGSMQDDQPPQYGNFGRPSPMGQRGTPNPMGMPSQVMPGAMRPQPIGNVPAQPAPQGPPPGPPPMSQPRQMQPPPGLGPGQGQPPQGQQPPQGPPMGPPPLGPRPPMRPPMGGMRRPPAGPNNPFNPPPNTINR